MKKNIKTNLKCWRFAINIFEHVEHGYWEEMDVFASNVDSAINQMIKTWGYWGCKYDIHYKDKSVHIDDGVSVDLIFWEEI